MTKPDTDLHLTRTFDAPRDLVWQAMTDPERLARWWGPKGFELHPRKFEFQPGGIFHFQMRSPDHEMWGRWIFREIVDGERIVFVNSFSDPEGGLTRPPFAPGFPAGILLTLTLREEAGRTILTLHGTPLDPTDEERGVFEGMLSSMQTGFGHALTQLGVLLAADAA